MKPAPRLLAVAYGGGHIAMVLPVLAQLRRERPDLRVDLLALTTARAAALRAGEQALGYADLLAVLSPAEQARVLELGRELLPGNTHPDIAEAESIAYLGINAWDLEMQFGADAARQRIAAQGRHGFDPRTFMRRVLVRLRPDLVLSTNSPRSEQAALQAAAAAGIPSVALLDLFGLPGDAFAARARQPGFAPPTRVCVLAPVVRDNLAAAGWPRERIVVTGNPAFDVLHAPALLEQARAWRRARGWEHCQVVLLAAQPEPRAHPDSAWPAGDALALELERALRAWSGGAPGRALIVRHHPNHWHRLPRLPDTPQACFSVPGEQALEPVLLAADAVVVQTSTVGLQAAVAGIPVLQMQCSPGALSGLDYVALGVAQGVPEPQDLEAALERLRRDPPAPTAWARAGSAAPAVAQQVLHCLDLHAAKADDAP